MIKIAPSILAADPLNLERDVRRAVEAGCDWIHIDVMDAHFVPNLAYTPETVRKLHETFRIPLDVHLMMDRPETLLEAFIRAGADNITVHAEIPDAKEMLAEIRNRGLRAGIALRPGTPLNRVQYLLGDADLVLMMTVEPGFGGQQMETGVLDKIGELAETGWAGEIEADGGIREDNLHLLTERGLTVAVMGTALFGSKDMKAAIQRCRAAGVKKG